MVAPVLHKYDVEPLADNVDAAPKQMAVGLAVAVRVGLGTTVIVLCAVFVHPDALVPVTVYIVVTVGDKVCGVPFKLPGNHV